MSRKMIEAGKWTAPGREKRQPGGVLAVLKAGIAGLARSRAGVTAVEFALYCPVFLIVIGGLVDYGMAIFDKMELVGAVRSGAQLALADSSDTTAIRQAVVDASGIDISLSNVTTTTFCECADTSTITCGDTCGDGSVNHYLMTVTATYTYAPMLLPSEICCSLTGTTTVRTQ